VKQSQLGRWTQCVSGLPTSDRQGPAKAGSSVNSAAGRTTSSSLCLKRLQVRIKAHEEPQSLDHIRIPPSPSPVVQLLRLPSRLVYRFRYLKSTTSISKFLISPMRFTFGTIVTVAMVVATVVAAPAPIPAAQQCKKRCCDCDNSTGTGNSVSDTP